MKAQHLVLFVALLLAPQSKAADTAYRMAIQDCISNITELTQFVELYPDAVVQMDFFAQVQYDNTPNELRAHALIEERYELSFHLKIRWDYNTRAIKKFGEPSFKLREYESIKWHITPDGQTILDSGKFNWRSERTFGTEEWTKLDKSHGDFSALGITLTRASPIGGLKAYYSDWKRRAEGREKTPNKPPAGDRPKTPREE